MLYWLDELLVEVAGEHLDVAGLVHHLRRGVVLGVDPRDGLDDAGGAQQRALLAVEELREQRVLDLDADPQPLLVAEVRHGRSRDVAEGLEAGRRAHRQLGRDLLGVDVGRPVRSVVTFHCDVLAFSYRRTSESRLRS